jgi:uncharacterized protein (TIGR03066 family)
MKLRHALLVALASSTMLTASAGAAPGADTKLLLGKWRAVALEAEGKRTPAPPGVVLITEFLSGGTFIGTETQQGKTVRKAGTWRVVGNLLTTVVEKKTRTYAYSLHGRQLRLTKEGKPVQHMILERLER